jgi:hypothetical protein
MTHDDETPDTVDPKRSDAVARALEELGLETAAEAAVVRQRTRRPGDTEDPPQPPPEPVNDAKTDLPDPGDPDVELRREDA